jgi:ribosomal-protein-alanine N-acetyltransferase
VNDLSDPDHPHLNIRRMELGDVLQVHALDVASFSLPWPERSFRYEVQENPNSRPWVAELDGRIVGMMVIWIIVDEAHVGTIAVAQEYRHQGIGRRLLAHGLLAARREGMIASLLEVRRSNLAAQQLYEQFGFTIVGIRPRYYRDSNEDAVLMNLANLQDEHTRLWLKAAEEE